MKTVLLALCLCAACGSSAFAQPAATATLRVTVVDPSNAIIVGATVTATGAEPATRAQSVPVATTADTGIATLTGLAPGRYTIQTEFPGFDTRTLQEVKIRSGENKQVAVLSISKLEASVNVEQDKQQAAADPRGRSFGTTLTREEIEALSDDPQQLQQQLQDMAGPGAVIRIDGFEGGALPAKAQIRSIRISRDQFAAEFHSAGGVSIEIITQPGIGPIRYFTNFRIRDDALTGTSPFVASRGPERNTNFGGGLNGTLIKDKSSFGLFVFGVNSYDTPNLFNPSYPDPGGLGTIPPINKYLLDAGYQMPRITRISGGLDQGFLRVNRVSMTYSYQQGTRLARGLNLNAALNGVRPDPAFRNIVQAVSDAESRQHQVQFDGNLNPGAMLPAFNGPLVSWKRTTMFINYQLMWVRNNTDGAFAIPATGDLNAEWGPAANDVRQRANITLNNQIVRNVLVGLSVNASSRDVYTLLTGRDDNGDGIFTTGRQATLCRRGSASSAAAAPRPFGPWIRAVVAIACSFSSRPGT